MGIENGNKSSQENTQQGGKNILEIRLDEERSIKKQIDSEIKTGRYFFDSVDEREWWKKMRYGILKSQIHEFQEITGAKKMIANEANNKEKIELLNNLNILVWAGFLDIPHVIRLLPKSLEFQNAFLIRYMQNTKSYHLQFFKDEIDENMLIEKRNQIFDEVFNSLK